MRVEESERHIVDKLSKSDLVLFIIMFALLPHTLYIEVTNALDANYVTYTFVASIWTLVISLGSNVTGNFSRIDILLPQLYHLIRSALSIILTLYILRTIWRYFRGVIVSNVRFRFILAILIVPLLYLGFFSLSLDGWYYSHALPFPLLQVLSSLFLLRKRSIGEATP